MEVMKTKNDLIDGARTANELIKNFCKAGPCKGSLEIGGVDPRFRTHNLYFEFDDAFLRFFIDAIDAEIEKQLNQQDDTKKKSDEIETVAEAIMEGIPKDFNVEDLTDLFARLAVNLFFSDAKECR